MKMQIILIGLLVQGTAIAQTSGNQQADLSYNFAELSFVDVDVRGGDGFRLSGSYELQNNWLIVGRVTTLDFDNNVDSTVLELGGGYLWHYSEDLDVVSTLRFVNAEAEVNGVSADDNGFALSAGVRALLAPQFEIRGSINHVNLDNSDTYLKLAGDYHFNEQFSAGASLEFAGDADTFAIGARWFFK